MQTTDAINTPLALSGQVWSQHAAQSELVVSQQQAQVPTQGDAQQSQQQTAHSMRMS
jgi:hypothetical protein